MQNETSLPSQMNFKERMEFFSKKIDSQGFLRSRVRIARVGVQYYADYGNVFRPPVEVIKSIPTFDNQIVVLDHPSEDVTVDNVRDLQVGFISNVRYRNGWLEGLVTITDSEVIQAVVSGNALEFSCGYKGDLVREPGVFNGDAYEAYVTGIVGNHVALVVEARAGIDATFIDSKASLKETDNIISSNVTLIEEKIMPEEIKDSLDPQSLQSELEATKLELAGYKAQAQALQDSLDSLSAQKDVLDLKLKDSKVELNGSEIASRVEAWTTIKPKLKDSVDINYGLTVPEVHKLWLAQELPNLAAKIKVGSESYISGLWDLMSERLQEPIQELQPVELPVKDSLDEPLISVLQAPLTDSVDTLELARQAYIERLAANRG